jgi:hypothetical protein
MEQSEIYTLVFRARGVPNSISFFLILIGSKG